MKRVKKNADKVTNHVTTEKRGILITSLLVMIAGINHQYVHQYEILRSIAVQKNYKWKWESWIVENYCKWDKYYRH